MRPSSTYGHTQLGFPLQTLTRYVLILVPSLFSTLVETSTMLAAQPRVINFPCSCIALLDVWDYLCFLIFALINVRQVNSVS